MHLPLLISGALRACKPGCSESLVILISTVACRMHDAAREAFSHLNAPDATAYRCLVYTHSDVRLLLLMPCFGSQLQPCKGCSWPKGLLLLLRIEAMVLILQDAKMHLEAEVPRIDEACKSLEAALAAQQDMEQQELHLLVFHAFHLMTVSWPPRREPHQSFSCAVQRLPCQHLL